MKDYNGVCLKCGAGTRVSDFCPEITYCSARCDETEEDKAKFVNHHDITSIIACLDKTGER